MGQWQDMLSIAIMNLEGLQRLGIFQGTGLRMMYTQHIIDGRIDNDDELNDGKHTSVSGCLCNKPTILLISPWHCSVPKPDFLV